MTTRRLFMRLIAGALVAAPAATDAQPAVKGRRIGWLGFNTLETARDAIGQFRRALHELGWVEGQNVLIEFRFAEGQVDRLPALVAELIRLNVDIIVAGSSASTRAAMNATGTLPIVMAASSDALGEGFVTSLAHPRGNVTGMTFLAGPEIAAKQLELLREIAPGASRVAVLANPSNKSHTAFIREVTAAAPRLGAGVQIVRARSADQIEGAFAAIARDRAGALLVLTDALFLGTRGSIVTFTARSRLPALYSQREFVDDGGLMSYGPSLSDMYRRAATHVDKILRGARPGDLPVEQPTKFELVLKLATAKAIGLTIPPSLLLRADQVLE